MEGMLTENMKELTAKGLQRKFIVAGLESQLRLFLDIEQMRKVEQAASSERDGLAEELVELTSNKVGAELYKSEIGTVRYHLREVLRLSIGGLGVQRLRC